MYRVWIKDEFSDNYTCLVVKDDQEVKKTILEAAKAGAEVLLTRDVAYELKVIVSPLMESPDAERKPRPTQLEKAPKEVRSSETNPSEAKSAENSGG